MDAVGFAMIDRCALEVQPLLTLNEALAQILAAIQPLQEFETVPLNNALGRVLADKVRARVDLPPYRNAAMDGYAFASRDIAVARVFALHCVGTAKAGRPFLGQLNPGECVRIFTGAAVPEQADSVIMQEEVQVQGKIIHFPAHIKAQQNVRYQGEDIRQGDELCTYPKALTAADLGLLAAAGIAEVTVVRPLKIAFFSTGDELVGLGRPLALGQIYDSNRYLLSGLLDDKCYEPIDGGVLADDQDQLEVALLKVAESVDVLITTGGASVGEADYIGDMLRRCGQVNFWKLAIKPGKPLVFGKLASSYFFGLPGNPLAVMATFRQLVRPGLLHLLGLPYQAPLRLTATCTSALKKSPGRQEFQCGILSQDDDGVLRVVSAGQQGSHLLGTLHKANCYIVLPSDCQGVQVGGQVVVEPFNVHI